MSSSSPSAKVADGRLILNLPDAETPALWVMDLVDAQTSVIRLETDRQGFFVLKKHGGGAKSVAGETVAVYRDRARGARALDIAASALEKARNTRIGAVGGASGIGRVGRFFMYFVLAWFLLWMIGVDKLVLRLVLTPFFANANVAAAPQVAPQAQQQQQPQPSPQFNGVPAGVPLSADEFLQNQVRSIR